MKQVCVLGNGQLGRMLRQAGEPLGIAVWPVGLDAEPAAVPFQQSVITAEIERWPETALTRELARHPAFVNRDVFPIIADRLTQKQLLTSSVWRLRRGNCWQIKANGLRYSTNSASWRSSNVASAATTVVGSGVCAQMKPHNCRMIAMASASSSGESTSLAKSHWLALGRMTAAPFSIR